MASKRQKMLAYSKSCYEKHLGHEMNVLGKPKKKLVAVVTLRDAVMLKLEGERFPTIYADDFTLECSCGEGRRPGTNEEESE